MTTDTDFPDPPNATPPSLGSPSKSRRDALKLHERPPLTLSNLTPISKYYSAADKVLAQFKCHLRNGELDDAYVIGRRFALFSTHSLPGHHYYLAPQHAERRMKNLRDAAWVTGGIERIVEVMDREELKKRERARSEEEDRERDWQRRMKERLLADSSNLDDVDMDEKLARLNALFPREEDAADSRVVCEDVELPPPIAPPVAAMSDRDSALFYSTSATQQLKSDGGTPMFVEDQPPSYSDLFLETLRTSSTQEDASLPSPSVPSAPSPQPPIRELRTKLLQEFNSLQSSKRIEVIKLATYQGRLSSTPRYDSTNGCTVISPLIVATHIRPRQKHAKCISNTEINEIIDKRAPPILTAVRSKLGLNPHALIIPSDVHDYFVDEGLLLQDMFVGVCGGNILEYGHWKVLLDMLEGKSALKDAGKRKIGAALFFRDHVISLLKIPLGNGSSYFDLIDSLPSPHAGGMASRTRCKDPSALETVMQWYACSKFTEAHCDFIDANGWDEGMCDFDPRVFQGFVWAG